MSWKITPTYDGLVTDPDATAYLAAVQAADGQLLEPGVRAAINAFVVGCKADGIWSAIKASCILAGARTLDGALVPLVGAAPTNVNFDAGDYNRETGLKGDGSKYLNSNRNRLDDPQNNMHISVYQSEQNSAGGRSMFGAGNLSNQAGATHYRISTGSDGYYRHSATIAPVFNLGVPSLGLIGINRAVPTSSQLRQSGSTFTHGSSSDGRLNESIHIFKSSGVNSGVNSRLAFYSIGEALDLALLDTRVTALINAIGAAIP